MRFREISYGVIFSRYQTDNVEIAAVIPDLITADHRQSAWKGVQRSRFSWFEHSCIIIVEFSRRLFV